MKAWLKKLFYAAISMVAALGGCNSVKTCPLPAPVAVQGTAPAVQINGVYHENLDIPALDRILDSLP